MVPRQPAGHKERSWYSQLSKPPECGGCPLEPLSKGYVPASGPSNSPIGFLGETPWYDELAQGMPFAGASGSMVERILRRNGWSRDQYHFDNTLRCAPPYLEFGNAPWLAGAVQHCRQYTDETLSNRHKVVVPFGGLAIRRALDLWGPGIKVEDFHGTVTRSPDDSHWVVPTFHPSYLQRGAVNLIGVVSFDLRRAHEVAMQGWEADPGELVIDPPVAWFRTWAEQYLQAVEQDPEGVWLAIDVETAEKAGKDESSLGPLTPEMLADRAMVTRSYKITRLNLSCHPDEGITVPFVGPYIEIAKHVLASRGVKLLWFGDYDWPRLEAAECPIKGEVWDLPWGCHLLQSDVPLGLGFWAPIYSRYGAWKHLSSTDEARYAAIDGLQTIRVGYGCVQDLLEQGMWYAFQRHVHDLKIRVLQPAHNVGVKIDRSRLEQFEADLTEKAAKIQTQIQEAVPDALRPLTGGPKNQGLRARPIHTAHTYARTTTARGEEKKTKPDALKQELFKHAEVVEKLVLRPVLVCRACEAIDIQKRHRCKDEQGKPRKDVQPKVEPDVATVRRWFWKEPFNPNSPPQLLAYMKSQDHKPGRAKKTGSETTDRETLQRLARTTNDPVYQWIINLRAVNKVRSTYVLGTKKRLDAKDRVHPVPTFRPSTQRLSYIDPNITNVITDRGGGESLAAGYRKCVVAEKDCRLLEVDFGSIEAVLTGWFAQDPGYIRLARLGVHAGLASHVLGRPFDPGWSDQDLGTYFKEIKSSEDPEIEAIYNKSKRTCHGNAYGLTEFGMVRNFPDTFENLTVARKYRKIFFDMAPKVPAWQNGVRQFADTHGFVGGSGTPRGGSKVGQYFNMVELDAPGQAPYGSPFGYKHWFWSIFSYRRISRMQYLNAVARAEKAGVVPDVQEINGTYYRIQLGEDSKRCVAFLPQSTAAGILKEKMLALFTDPDHESYIGDAYHGQTPLRAPIHDSMFLEVPIKAFDRVLEAVCREMLRPVPQMPMPAEWEMGEFLSIGVDAKAGAAGGSWAEIKGIETPSAQELGVSADRVYFPAEESEEEEEMDLGVVA